MSVENSWRTVRQWPAVAMVDRFADSTTLALQLKSSPSRWTKRRPMCGTGATCSATGTVEAAD
ncbi:hypothetical protein ABOY03_13840, partial [Clavibacter michiganensis]|uniref:hypothetical protein n=1 Tax=Clavibacter michiganensis TaxID=28447 RepID=UPI0037567298